MTDHARCIITSGTVLIIEDDADIRDVLADILREEGYQVATAEDGIAALAWLERNPEPCIILLDLYMPVMDGEEFRAAQLRDQRRAHIPIIVVSAARDVDTRARALGAAGYLQKPLQLEELLEIVAAIC